MSKLQKLPQTRAWQRMLSGRRLDLLDPSPFDIEIEDIAHGLARVARWNGQTNGDHAFSVAEHCIVVEDSLPGVQAARAAGMRALAYVGAAHSDSAALQAAGGRTFDSMSSLPMLAWAGR